MNSRLIHGILLVAGTSIGGGMLALPVTTGQVGFYPSLGIYLACWLFMASTGLLFLEVSLWMKDGENIVSMAERTLGAFGKAVTWGLYLFLFYCLTLVYIVGMGNLFVQGFKGFIPLEDWQGQVLFLLLFGPVVYAGTRVISRLNLFLMLGLGISYVMFVFFGFTHVDSSYLTHTNWSRLWIALPVTFTSFAYQGIIPTLVDYMKRDAKQIRLAILIGSFLPFVAYTIWQWLILGVVPAEGPNSLAEAMRNGQNAVVPLKNLLDVPDIYLVGQCFAFFALVTSFIGVTLGLMDFLADGLKVEKTPSGRLGLSALILIPPLMVAFAYPHVFLTALGYAGGFGCALLLGLLPVAMVWVGRYHMGLTGEYRFFGGRLLLGIFALFVAFELFCEVAVIAGFVGHG